MSGRTIEIAEHLWTVLETMARDMATEPRALVNQAVFNWARRNGYAVSAAAAQPGPKVQAQAQAEAEAEAEAPAQVPAPRAEVVLVEEPVPEAKPQPVVATKVAEPAPVATPAPAPLPSMAARIAAIDADVDRYCLVPVVVDADFGEADEEPAEEPSAPVVDLNALRGAVALRVAAIDRAVDDVLPRPSAPAPAPAPVPVPVFVPVATPLPIPVPAAARPTLTIAPATLASSSPTASPTPVAEAGMSRPRLNTSELDSLLGEVDDILGQNVVRDTALSPAIPFVLELRVRGTDQVCTVATEPVVIGRGQHCDLVLQSAEASREHAVVVRNGGTYVIEDRGSSNGTWFGAEQVRSREIHSGDVFRIGSLDVVASFKIGDTQAKAG
ncbi:MAG: FHA domain-containing protein [Myxococcota bacterium]